MRDTHLFELEEVKPEDLDRLNHLKEKKELNKMHSADAEAEKRHRMVGAGSDQGEEAVKRGLKEPRSQGEAGGVKGT